MIDLNNLQYVKKIKQLTSKLKQANEQIALREEKIIELEAKLKVKTRRKRKRK